MNKSPKKQKFSLMECIVVIAVVMTVASIVFTSVKSSSDLAKKVTCMSNIAQIRAYTELYRKDHGKLPYSDIWLTDFSYVSAYMNDSAANLSVFICPGSDDEALTSSTQLTKNTSYYYMPARAALENNIVDGQIYGFSLLNLNALSQKNQLVIYDKSPAHHNGSINVAYLFGDDDPGFRPDGEITTTQADSFLTLDASGELVLEDAESFGTLSINPAQSDNNLFTLVDTEGNVIMISMDQKSATGTAVKITLKVKNNDRQLEFGDDVVKLDTNSTYDIEATKTEESGELDPYYIYELTHDGTGQGQWFLDIFQGIGGITVTNNKTGETFVLDGVAD